MVSRRHLDIGAVTSQNCLLLFFDHRDLKRELVVYQSGQKTCQTPEYFPAVISRARTVRACDRSGTTSAGPPRTNLKRELVVYQSGQKTCQTPEYFPAVISRARTFS